MVPRTRSFAVPQLEVIRASDETTRAELIALPVVRTDLGDYVIEDPLAAAAIARGDIGLGGIESIA